MANEDNRVSNLIGLPISDWALKQLNTRSEKNSLDSRSNGLDNSNIVYLANKTGWVKLVSSVDIKSADVLAFLKEQYGLTVNYGPDLAKNFVLSGGTLAYKGGNSFSLRSGLDSYSILGDKEVSAYGYRPMPGITGVSIKTLGKLGSFRQAEVKFKALDKFQLDIIDILYLRLGYTMFLEWAQTFYYKSGENNTTLEKTEKYSIPAFQDNLDKDTLRRKIAQNIRESEGNYDAMLGMVTNFNFTMTQDGGYDCTITLTSIGILGDSTRINVYANLNAKLQSEIKNLVSIITKLWKAQKDRELAELQKQQQVSQPPKLIENLNSYPPCIRDTGLTPKSVKPKNGKDPKKAFGVIHSVDGIEYIFYAVNDNDNGGPLQTSALSAEGEYKCDGINILVSLGGAPFIQPKGSTYEGIINSYLLSNKNLLRKKIGSGYTQNFDNNTVNDVYYIPTKAEDLLQNYQIPNDFPLDKQIKQEYLAFSFNKSLIPLNVSSYDVSATLQLEKLNTLDAFKPDIKVPSSNTQTGNIPQAITNTGLPAANTTNFVITKDQKSIIDLLLTPKEFDPYQEIIVNNNSDYFLSYIKSTKNDFYKVLDKGKSIVEINTTYATKVVQTPGGSSTVLNSQDSSAGTIVKYRANGLEYVTSLFFSTQTSSPIDRQVVIAGSTFIISQDPVKSFNYIDDIKNSIINDNSTWSVVNIEVNKGRFDIFITLKKTIFLEVQATATNVNFKPTSTPTKVSLPLYIRTNDPFIIKSIDVPVNSQLRRASDYSNPNASTSTAASNGAPQAAPPPEFKLDAIQQDNSLKYRSAIEIMLRILQVHTYEQASKTKGADTLVSGNYNKIHTESIQTEATEKLYLQLFGDGIFSGFLTELFNKKIHPTKDQYEKETTDKLLRFKYDSAYGFHRGLLSDKVKIPEDSKQREDFEKKYLVNYAELTKTYLVPYKQSQDLIEGSNLNYPVYVSLGFFIMMLNHISTLYVSDEDKVIINTDIPLYYIDFNPETNFCLSNSVQFTTNPYNFLIPIEGTAQNYKNLFPKNVNTTNFWNTDSGDTLSKEIPKFRVANIADSSTYDSFRGKTMNVLVSIDYLLNIISSHTAKDSTNSVYLKPMLEEVISDMNKTFGNYNMLRLGFDDTSDCFFISDDQLIPDKSMICSDGTVKAEIPIYGKKSIAKSFDIKTEVSSKLANVLAISANSDAASQANGGTDGSSFGVYNVSYLDRYKKIVTSKNDANFISTGSNSGEASAAQYAAELFDNSIKRYYNTSDNVNSTSENMIGHTVNYYIELMAKSKNDNEGTRGSAMIPLSLNLSMDGMSGLGIGQAFTINEKLLPYRYVASTRSTKNKLTKVGFIITGLDHEFSSNVWTTSIRTSMYYLKNIGDYSSTLNTNRPSLEIPSIYSEGPCSREEIDAASKTVNGAWVGKYQVTKTTIIDPLETATQLITKLNYSRELTTAILSIIKVEQNFKGFNHNYAGYDLTNSSTLKFNQNSYNGFAVAREGGTKRCKAYVSFNSYETFINDFKERLKRKGFAAVNNASDFAEKWYLLWNGEGAADKISNLSREELKARAIKTAATAWTEMNEIVKKL
jgi:hypothetical protein